MHNQKILIFSLGINTLMSPLWPFVLKKRSDNMGNSQMPWMAEWQGFQALSSCCMQAFQDWRKQSWQWKSVRLRIQSVMFSGWFRENLNDFFFFLNCTLKVTFRKLEYTAVFVSAERCLVTAYQQGLKDPTPSQHALGDEYWIWLLSGTKAVRQENTGDCFFKKRGFITQNIETKINN